MSTITGRRLQDFGCRYTQGDSTTETIGSTEGKTRRAGWRVRYRPSIKKKIPRRIDRTNPEVYVEATLSQNLNVLDW